MPKTGSVKEFLDVSKIKLQKLKIKFDLYMLENILGFIYKESVLRTRKALMSTYKLFTSLDESTYEKDVDLKSRIWVIQKSLEARLFSGFENDGPIKQFCLEHRECDEAARYVISCVDKYKKALSYEESKFLVNAIDDRLKFGYVVTLKEIFQDVLDGIDSGDYKSFKAINEELYDIAASVVNIKRSTNSLDSDETFSLREEMFEAVVSEAVERLRDKNKVFITGIQRLNTILSPGYHSKRLYVYLAFPGGGKSVMLLKSALDIKKYNTNVRPKDPNKTPAVLFITMENTIDETIERMFNMTVSADDIRNYTPKQVIKKLKDDGEMKLTDSNGIDIIIKYYKNREISTDDIYTIIKDLDDAGSETIALILDYLKRIRSSEKANDDKTELKNITNELKTISQVFDIPVITAQQLNRQSATIIDAAMQAKKEDLTRLIGRDGVANSWEIHENCDWMAIINQEVKTDTGDLYLTFKRLKLRYRPVNEEDEKLRRLDYFNHPFAPDNTIRLIDDVDKPESLSILSLATSFMSADDTKRGKKNAVERKSKSSFKAKDDDDYDTPFNVDQLVVD